jgi:hypothetical protein
MAEQEIFDRVAVHLLTQKVHSINGIGECCYRGNNNTRCAVGCLIDDEEYHPDMKCSFIWSVIKYHV